MSLLSLQNAHFDFGREPILRGANVALQAGVKCALVGANGAGKTTLLAALAGKLQVHGTRQVTGSAQIELLRQETSLEADPLMGGRLLETVADAAFGKERELEHQLHELATELANAGPGEHEDMVTRQGTLQNEFERLDGYTMQSRLEAALTGVGLLPESWGRRVDQLSGGERRRAALAVVLLSGADLLLLDEPTNHLDLESCEWLEEFLEGYPGAAVIVSHDRHFLDRVAKRTLHLDRGKVISYSGNYSFFDKQSALRYEQDLNAWERQQNKFRQTEEYIRRNIEGQKTRQAQSRRKQMDKEEVLEKPTAEPGLYRFHLTPFRQSGGTALETHQLAKGFGGRPLMTGLDLHISRGDRIGIIGPNGCGKSTLLKMLAGRVVPDAGRVVVGHNVDIGFYDQELSGVSDHNTVIGEMMAVDPAATLGELRSFLGAFGFGEDLYDRQVARLSGGERGRLSLLRLIKEGHNTLLLDEPTNHLDTRSRESLEAALAEFTGTMVVVSHDRRFIDKIVNRLIVFPAPGAVDASIRVFDGNYSEYVWKRNQERQSVRRVESAPVSTAPTPAKASHKDKTPLSKNEQKRRQQWIDEAEASILRLEEEKEAGIAEMADPGLDNERRAELGRRITEIDAELEQQLASWEAWSLEIDEGVNPD